MQTSVSSVDAMLAAGPPAAVPHSDVDRAEIGKPFRQIVEDASIRETQAEPKPDNAGSADEIRAKEPAEDRGRLEPPASDQPERPEPPVHGEKATETQERDGSAVLVSSEQVQTGRLAPGGAPSTSRRTSQAAPSAAPSAAEQTPGHTKTQLIPGGRPVDTAQSELGSRGRTSAKPESVASIDGRGGWKGSIRVDGEPRLDKHVESGGGRGPIQAPTGPARKNPDAAAQSSPDAAAQKNPRAAARSSPDVVAQKNPDAAAQKNPDAVAQKNPDAAAQKNPDAAAQKNPDAAAQKNPDAVAQGSPDATAHRNPDTAGQTTSQKQGTAGLAPPADASRAPVRQEGISQQTLPHTAQEPGQADTTGTGKDAGARLPVPSQGSPSARTGAQQSDNREHLRPETSSVVSEQSQDGQSKLVSTVGLRDAANPPAQSVAASQDVPRTSPNQQGQSAGSGQVPPAVIGRQSSRIIGEQIMESLGASIQRGQNNILIRLNPPELGRVWVTLQERQGQVVGLLEAERAETGRQIDQVLPEIVRSLEDSGIQVRRLDVSHADPGDRQAAKDSLGSQQEWTQQRDLSQGHSRPEPRSVALPTPPQDAVFRPSEPQVEAGPGGLNMLI